MKLYQVDAFTAAPFAGNPAGVCFLDRERESGWMQAVAAEMNLSETAFCVAGGEVLPIRYFTPTVEVSLCGHATLATAHMLWELGRIPADKAVRFRAPGHSLQAQRDGEWIEMTFPAFPSKETAAVAEIAAAIGIEPQHTLIASNDIYLVELADAAAVRAVTPDFGLLRDAPVDSLCITARGGNGGPDFVSRYFAPRYGIDEDPVTGVAHCILAPYWFERLGHGPLTGHQVSRRGGIVRVSPADDDGHVKLAGQAVTVFKLEMVDG